MALLGGLTLLLVSAIGCAGDRAPESRENASELSDVQRDRINALGYATRETLSADDADKSGVTRYDPERSQPGLNLWNSLPDQRTLLMDAHGEEVFAWERETTGEWGHTELLASGELLVLHQDPNQLQRLDLDSEVVWRHDMLAHHDLDVGPDGRLFVLDRRIRRIVQEDQPYRVWVDDLLIFEDDVTRPERLPFTELLADRIDLRQAPATDTLSVQRSPIPFVDPLHVNAIAVVTKDQGPVLRRGQVLFCSRSLNLIGLIDLEAREVVWSWGPEELDWPHQPIITQAGTILLLDNGWHRDYSRLVEVDPATNEIVWEYRADPAEDFYTQAMGGIQELENGNVLVTESKRGRVFELTRTKEIVWEYFNPDVRAGTRATLYRMTRYPEADLPDALLDRL